MAKMATDLKQIFPRNLTARAAYRVAGNPVVTRPEDAVANCYPGLELDVRNLDRRFFPGLVFEFIARSDVGAPYTEPERYGALLAYVDLYGDPDLQLDTKEARELLNQLQSLDFTGQWYVDWIEQAGKRLEMTWHRPDPTRDDPQRRESQRTPLDGLYVWRLVRSLEPGPVSIGLVRRDKASEVTLNGWRRRYTDPSTGVLSAAYQPGELLQSLCSPWTHDFRDCACHYWASNHPDVVLGEVLPGEPTLPDGRSTDPIRGTMPLDWLRHERRRDLAGGAHNTIPKNRPYQYDHLQANHAWQKLAIVLQDQEIGSVYVPRLADTAVPYASPTELAQLIREHLAPLELALAIEYLYACFSIRAADEADRARWPTMADDVVFMRHYLLLTAQSEMLHLRWANELLWALYDAKLIPNYEPVLEPALLLPAPTPSGFRPRALLPLTPEVTDGFLFIEDPGGFIDSTYGRVIATLRQPEYPSHLVDLSVRVITDGVEHFSRFKDIRKILLTYQKAQPPNPYLRSVHVGTPEQAKQALEKYESIRADLKRAYVTEARGQPVASGKPIANARQTMLELYEIAEGLARQGIGIPFWPVTT
jgi:hypothetical protein